MWYQAGRRHVTWTSYLFFWTPLHLRLINKQCLTELKITFLFDPPPLTPWCIVCLFVSTWLSIFEYTSCQRNNTSRDKCLYHTAGVMASKRESDGLDNLAFDVSSLQWPVYIEDIKKFLLNYLSQLSILYLVAL